MTAVARVHERLYRSANVHSVDLAAYLADVCADFDALAPQATVQFTSTDPIGVSTDRCVRVALLLTELVTNAAEHATGTACTVAVNLSAVGDDAINLSVRDDGVGLPKDFEMAKSKGLGMKLIAALVNQTGGKCVGGSQSNRCGIHSRHSDRAECTARLVGPVNRCFESGI